MSYLSKNNLSPTERSNDSMLQGFPGYSPRPSSLSLHRHQPPRQWWQHCTDDRCSSRSVLCSTLNMYGGTMCKVYSYFVCAFVPDNLSTFLILCCWPGHISTVNYLLNYYPGADTEIRDCRGFTALIKAAMQGRNEVVSALIMAGSNDTSQHNNSDKSFKETWRMWWKPEHCICLS